MKRDVLSLIVIIAITALWCGCTFGDIGVKVNAETSAIPLAFSNTDTYSQVITCGPGVFSIHNKSGGGEEIAWAIGATSPAPSTAMGYVASGGTFSTKLFSPNSYVYIRSDYSTAITTGDVYVSCEGN